MDSPKSHNNAKCEVYYKHCKKTLCVVKKGMILSETKAKGIAISFLKRVENDLSMLSCHLHGHLTPFHSLLLANKIIIHNRQLIIFHTFSLLST